MIAPFLLTPAMVANDGSRKAPLEPGGERVDRLPVTLKSRSTSVIVLKSDNTLYIIIVIRNNNILEEIIISKNNNNTETKNK